LKDPLLKSREPRTFLFVISEKTSKVYEKLSEVPTKDDHLAR
jgi:hypothetical protein